MSLQRLTAASMVSLTAPWVALGSKERRAFARVPELAALLPYIDSVHNRVLSAQGTSIVDRLAPIISALVSTDNRHDEYWRALYFCLQGQIHLCNARGEHARAAELTALQTKLMPNGLSVVSMSYRDEVGEAEFLASRMTPEMRAELSAMSVENGTLEDVTDELLKVAGELGRLEDERGEVREFKNSATMASARNSWLRMVTVVRNLLDALEVSDPVIDRVLARLRDAEKAAARRAQGEPEPESDLDLEPEPGQPDDTTDEPLPTTGDTDSEPGDVPGDESAVDEPIVGASLDELTIEMPTRQ